MITLCGSVVDGVHHCFKLTWGAGALKAGDVSLTRVNFLSVPGVLTFGCGADVNVGDGDRLALRTGLADESEPGLLDAVLDLLCGNVGDVIVVFTLF